ncbi:MAG: primosomal protein N' [Desulforhopalus sp.]|nr:primosomal protein N' [Desulforhopalus sp.]
MPFFIFFFMPQLLEIAVAAPLFHTLTYVLSDDLTVTDAAPLIGRRVFVPLGRQRVTGYILGPGEAIKENGGKKIRLRNVLQLLDYEPFFHGEMVPFFRWVAEYYLYPIGQVIKAALPGGTTVKGGRRLVRLCDPCELPLEEAAWLKVFVEKKELSMAESSALLRKKGSAKILARLCEEGQLQSVETIVRERTGRKMEECFSLSPELQKISACFLKEQKDDVMAEILKNFRKKIEIDLNLDFSVAQTRTVYTLATLCTENELAELPGRELRRVYSGASKPLAQLLEQGSILQHIRRIFRDPFGGMVADFSLRYTRPELLSPQQQEVLKKINPAIEAHRYETFLLHGITGSGKTEVYLRAAETTLAKGRDVIVLVPEIALATQLEGQFVARFGDQVVLQHSGLSAPQKLDQYSLALSGEAKIVIGARSAIFAPVKDPGLIIVDEEHDGSYKQDDSFRYNGRDLAVVRGLQQESTVILGSATPSVTSFAHGRGGKFTLLSMDKRIGESHLPEIVLVDLNARHQLQRSRILSETLLEKMEQNLAVGHQTILLMNRRGFSSAILCSQCGTPVQCPHCNVSMTLHKHNNRLICHYCGNNTAWLPGEMVCSQCRSTALAPAGFGTERVEEETQKFFPDAVVRRIDSDIAGDRRQFHKLLEDMRERRIDILIGTQMIAKGHHFPAVTLVGAVWADGGMSMPDYKAAEKSFQLITQVTGRAGRGELPGEVVIQTLRPEHYAIYYATRQQYVEFFDYEYELRRNPAFPPFVRLVLFRLKGRVEDKVRLDSIALARFCRQWAKEEKVEIEILGPAPSPIDKVRDSYRYQILVRGQTPSLIHRLSLQVLTVGKEIIQGGTEISVDIDPENMM